MNTTQAQQKALDDALVPLWTVLSSGNATSFLITAEVLAIYRQEFWATVFVHKSSIRFTINKKKFSLDVEIFREILQIFPKILGQEFEDLPLEHDILSFIRDLGYSGDITYLTDVSVDYLHQPWRAFATVINKCLSGKETGMDKIRLSRLVYFKEKQDVWHTAQDDSMFTAMRCISRHEDTQVYGTILPKDLTNQAMLESKAYKTYYAFASGEKTLKPKYVRKKDDSDTSPKQKPVQATEGTRLKIKAKVAKSDKKKQPTKIPKPKGLDVLSKVALIEGEQIKLATKRSKTQFHSSYASGSSDGFDTQSNVPDEQQQKTFGTNEGTDSDEEDDHDEHEFEDDADDDGNDNDGNDDKVDSDRTESDREEIPNLNQSNVEQTEEEEYRGEEQQNVSQVSSFEQVEEDFHVIVTPVLDAQKTDDPVQSSFVSFDFTSELLNLDNTPPHLDDTSSQTSSLFTVQVTAIPEITSATTVPPPPSSFNPLPQQATHTLITFEATTSTPALPDYPFVFKFKERVINLEKDLLEMKQVDLYAKAISFIPAIMDCYIDNKLGEAINKAILAYNLDCRQEAQDEKNEYIGLIDTSMRTIIKEEVTTQLPQILPQAVSDFATPVIEKNVTESLEVAVLTRDLYKALVTSYQTDKDLFNTYGEIFSFKRDQDNKDKDQDPSTGLDRGSKRRKSSKDAESSRDSRSKEKKSSSTSKGASQSQHKSSSKSAYVEEPSHIVEDSEVQQDQEFITGDYDEQPADKEVTKADCQAARAEERRISFNELMDIPIDFFAFVLNRLNIQDLTQAILKYDYGHLEEIEVRRDDQELYKFREGDFSRLHLQDIDDMLLLLVQQKLTNLAIDKRYDLNMSLRMYTRHIVIQRRVEDLQLGVESYQTKLNLTKPDSYRSNLRNRTAYTSYSDPQGVIYVDNFDKKRLMRADELHKFSDGTLNDVRTALHDISKGIRMEYLPKRKWSGLDKKRARVMIQDIDKQLFEIWLMRNLEKFVGG
ncbi:hypothetical protein Tco_1107845 [Tanacetum coccineum]